MTDILDVVCRTTGARSATLGERVQSLWSGYGEIVRVGLDGAAVDSVIVKRVAPPTVGSGSHPRGWDTDRSHLRKLRSYEVESHWYASWTPRCEHHARVPHCHGVEVAEGGERILVLEDLDAAGFDGRRHELSTQEFRRCLQWLAEFHATFVGAEPDGLWSMGTYWHLETRPDELREMRDVRLRRAAPELDRLLREASFRTIVHGDAKVANFCFADASKAHAVAAVDFQYVGGGCGIQDVAYFLGSCLDEHQLDEHADAALDTYFAHLGRALQAWRPEVDAGALEREWRSLYDVAWADFVRFLNGWVLDGQHVKLHEYSGRITNAALRRLGY